MATPVALQILYADRLESTIGTLLLIHDREGHMRALDFHDFESRMRRLLRFHYGAEGNDFTIEGRAAPTAIRRAISDYFLGDLCAINSAAVVARIDTQSGLLCGAELGRRVAANPPQPMVRQWAA